MIVSFKLAEFRGAIRWRKSSLNLLRTAVDGLPSHKSLRGVHILDHHWVAKERVRDGEVRAGIVDAHRT